jgi:hypothetical protein
MIVLPVPGSSATTSAAAGGGQLAVDGTHLMRQRLDRAEVHGKQWSNRGARRIRRASETRLNNSPSASKLHRTPELR